MNILHEEFGLRNFIVCEVRVDVELLNFVKAFHIVLCLTTDSITFDDTDIQVASEHKGIKVLQGYRNTASSDKWIINKITLSNLSLIGHHKS